MTDAQMEAWSKAWWAAHPRVGRISAGAPAATFTVGNFIFDLDGNTGTQVDTAKILVGETVRWQWVIGIHTVTNGNDGLDPNAGTLFDQPSSSADPQFDFAFNTAGTFPFFCRPHEGFQMKGVVQVSSTTGVGPRGDAIGFTSGPAPNPTNRGVTFGFALRQAGRARADVLDAGGRRVAVLVNRDLEAGPHFGAWDGRVEGGGLARPGLYWVKLRLPGYASSRSLVIMR